MVCNLTAGMKQEQGMNEKKNLRKKDTHTVGVIHVGLKGIVDFHKSSESIQKITGSMDPDSL